MVDFAHGAPVSGDLDVEWSHGVPRGAADPGPPIQVHEYDEHTIILRQSKSTHYEAPFLYLLMGNDRAVLFDTGATPDPAVFPLRDTVDRLLASWQERNGRPDHHLVVAHSHAHGDHVAADDQFAGRADTTVVGHDPMAVQQFFGFASWPEEVVQLDLGGRVLEVTGIPGHHPASIAVFDPWTGFLLTGDSVYPGRLYADDMTAFLASAERLVEFAATRPVRHVMGCHIEMTRTPGRDYPVGTTYQPDEPPLQLAPDRLLAVRDGARAATARPGVHVFPDFLIFNGTGPTAMPRLMLRTLRQRLAARWGRLTS
jgi:glyoxylase-like metal-dependent hydrolase (beta-lactamase superfamily II)